MSTLTAVTAMILHQPVARSELWSDWRPDPLIVVVLALTVVVYHHGLARLARRTRRWPRRRSVVAFDGGLAALAVALASPLDAAAASIFSAHMVQHLVLTVVAAPLLVCGRPGLVFTWALPARPRRVVRRMGAHPAVRRAAGTLSNPVVVWGVATMTLWAWHHPALYEAAVNHDAVHVVEHATLLGTAAAVWAVALGRVRHPVPVPAAALLLFATALQGGALGAVLSLARTPLYEVHSAMAPRWGLTPLGDQQLAGVLMWMPAGLVYLGVAATLLVRWFGALEAPPVVGATGPLAGPVTGSVAGRRPS
jgi:cytochrome c oxidase assembly factor CtaG